jgi:hypothetical protein
LTTRKFEVLAARREFFCPIVRHSLRRCSSNIAKLARLPSFLRQLKPGLLLPTRLVKPVVVSAARPKEREEAAKGSQAGRMSAAETKSYLPPGLAVFSPWASKGTSSKASSTSSMAEAADGQLQGKDHVVSHRHRLSLREYPPDCPPLKARWFYAVDVCCPLISSLWIHASSKQHVLRSNKLAVDRYPNASRFSVNLGQQRTKSHHRRLRSS